MSAFVILSKATSSRIFPSRVKELINFLRDHSPPANFVVEVLDASRNGKAATKEDKVKPFAIGYESSVLRNKNEAGSVAPTPVMRVLVRMKFALLVYQFLSTEKSNASNGNSVFFVNNPTNIREASERFILDGILLTKKLKS